MRRLAAIVQLRKPHPLRCAGCGAPAEVELTPLFGVAPADAPQPDLTPREYLCYEDLGTFLGTMTDQRIRSWVVTRLPEQ